MKVSVLVLLVFLVAVSSAAPDRYLRSNTPAKVCNKGDFLASGKCWRPCPKGYSQQWNNRLRCQKNCAPGETSKKGRCYTKRCPKGYRAAAGRCYSLACPRGFVNLNSTTCQRPCPKPYTAAGRKCVNRGAKPGQCDSYTRPTTKRASRPFIVYPQSTKPRSWYWPRCPSGHDMIPVRRCLGPCKKGYVKKGKWCKNKDCFTEKRRHRRGGPKNPTVCPKGYDLRNVRCWKRCPAGYSHQWNNWFRCQKNCAAGETSKKGRCYTKRCPKGYRVAAGRCYSLACPRGFVNLNATTCQRPCPKPYTAAGRKCVNRGAKPGQCDSYTRPTANRANRPFIVYPQRTIPKANRYPGCPGGWRMEKAKCRKLCPARYTVRGDFCELTICINI